MTCIDMASLHSDNLNPPITISVGDNSNFISEMITSSNESSLSEANSTQVTVPTNSILQSSPNALPRVRHCVTLLFPALAADSHKLAKGSDQCSHIDRHGFALVLLACCLTIATGNFGELRIIACLSFTDEMLAECATLLCLGSLWSRVAQRITRFDTYASLVSAMNVADFVPSPMIKHSLFIVSHADPQRLRVHLAGSRCSFPQPKWSIQFILATPTTFTSCRARRGNSHYLSRKIVRGVASAKTSYGVHTALMM